MLATAPSTSDRPANGPDRNDSAAEIAQLQHTVSSLYKLFDLGLGLIQLDGRLSKQLDPLLKQCQRSIEVDAIAFQLRDNLFEAIEV